MKHTSIIVAIGLALAAGLSAAPAAAQAGRTFVSSHGNDANNCSLTAPCRSFAAAFAVTNASGEIDVLDTAGYGALIINKAISIVNDGSIASVLVPSGGNGITINAGANDAVTLRGLTIEGAGVAQTGIKFNSGKSLTVENCVIRHMTDDGIDFQSTTATSALTVLNSLLADNGINGVVLDPTGSVTAVFNRVEVINNGEHGIFADGEFSAGTNTINVTVFGSVASGNGAAGSGVGFAVRTLTGAAPTSVMIFHSVAANNGNGVEAQGLGATLELANSTVRGNTNGWLVQSSGVVGSYGDNYINGNGSNTGSLTPISKQ